MRSACIPLLRDRDLQCVGLKHFAPTEQAEQVAATVGRTHNKIRN